MFCLEICTPEGRGGEKGGSANYKIKHAEPLIQGLTPPQDKIIRRTILDKGTELRAGKGQDYKENREQHWTRVLNIEQETGLVSQN